MFKLGGTVTGVETWGTVSVFTALVSPAVGGSSLVAERARYPLMGFDLEVLTLTVAHFHYAGFAAALVAGLVCQAVPGGLGELAAVTVPAGTVLVAIGHFAGDWVELAGALIFSATTRPPCTCAGVKMTACSTGSPSMWSTCGTLPGSFPSLVSPAHLRGTTQGLEWTTRRMLVALGFQCCRRCLAC